MRLWNGTKDITSLDKTRLNRIDSAPRKERVTYQKPDFVVSNLALKKAKK